MTTTEIIFLLIMAAGMLIFGLLYGHYRDKEHYALFFKGAATCMAVLPALLYAFYLPSAAAWLIASGTFFCMAADVLLEIRFLSGVSAFGLAHVCFIAGFLNDFSISCVTVFLWFSLYIGMFIGFRHLLKNLKALALAGFIYAALLCATCAVSISRFLALHSISGFLCMIAGIFFFISDNILAYCTLAEIRSRKNSAILLTLYFTAVYLFALSLYI